MDKDVKVPFRFADRELTEGTEGRVKLRKDNSLEKEVYFIERADTISNLLTASQINSVNLNNMLEYIEGITKKAVESAQSSADNAKNAVHTATVAQSEAKTAQIEAQAATTNSNSASKDAENAITKATEAKTLSQTAIGNASESLRRATDALANSNNANTWSADAKSTASQASVNAISALMKSAEIEELVNSIEFEKCDGVLVEASGMYGFQIIGGDLMLSYSENNAPDFSINTNGELIFNF